MSRILSDRRQDNNSEDRKRNWMRRKNLYNFVIFLHAHLQLERADWSADSVYTLFELNEVLSAQSLAVVKKLKIDSNEVIMITLVLTQQSYTILILRM